MSLSSLTSVTQFDPAKRMVTALIALTILLLPTPSIACKCAHDPRPISQQVAAFLAAGVGNRKVTVFHGTVTNIERGGPRRIVTFLADAYWATPVSREVSVETGLSDADCGYHFEVEKDYLVFADSFQGKPWYTDICMLTTAYDGPLIVYLGPKTEIPSEIPWWVKVGGAVLCLTVLFYILANKRSKVRTLNGERI